MGKGTGAVSWTYPLSAPVFEIIDLIGQAIAGPPVVKQARFNCRRFVAALDPVSQQEPNLDTRLAQCWPLHPATSLLLGPISRRRFGQKERSVFSFLCSREPGAFSSFIEKTHEPEVSYEPSRLWDYMELNLESAILSSSDACRWAEAADAVERARRKGTALHVRIAKTIALCDVFGRIIQLNASTNLFRPRSPMKTQPMSMPRSRISASGRLLFSGDT
jgi:hypothetical protein